MRPSLRSLTPAAVAIVLGYALFFASSPGPEGLLAGRPMVIVTVIFAQIVVTLWAVWWGARSSRRAIET